MNFISLVIANSHLLNLETGAENSVVVRQLFGEQSRLRRLSFAEYEKIGCLTQDLLIHLMTTLDLLHNDGVAEGEITAYLCENTYYDEEATFVNVLKNDTSYSEKLRFYAFYTGLENGWRDEQLLDWMRVVYNITENTIFNSVDDYHRALRSIQILVAEGMPVLELLKEGVKVPFYSDPQVTEERVKAHLLERSSEWKDLIFEVEGKSSFRGQIGWILSFAGIVDYYLDHGNTDWGDSHGEYWDRFQRYAEAGMAVFECIEDGSSDIDYTWERAVLSKGDYLTFLKPDRYNLLSTRHVKNNIERDHSWRRLLRLADEGSVWEERQRFVKEVLDDSLFSAEDVQGSLEKICSIAIEHGEIDGWRKLLIKCPELVDTCKQGFLVKNEKEVVLLHQSKRNHTNSEIFSKHLALQLESEGVDISPFQWKFYREAVGRVPPAHLCLFDFKIDDHTFEMRISYASYRYQVEMLNHGDALQGEWPILAILSSFGFSENFDEDQNFVSYGVSVDESTLIIDFLQSLLLDFKALVDE